MNCLFHTNSPLYYEFILVIVVNFYPLQYAFSAAKIATVHGDDCSAQIIRSVGSQKNNNPF